MKSLPETVTLMVERRTRYGSSGNGASRRSRMTLCIDGYCADPCRVVVWHGKRCGTLSTCALYGQGGGLSFAKSDYTVIA